jgi:hypothetical protein
MGGKRSSPTGRKETLPPRMDEVLLGSKSLFTTCKPFINFEIIYATLEKQDLSKS